MTYATTETLAVNGVAGTPTTGTLTENSAVTGTSTIGGAAVVVTRNTDSASPTYAGIYYDAINGTQVLDYGIDNVNSGVTTSQTRYSVPQAFDLGLPLGQVQTYSYVETDTDTSNSIATSYSVSGSATVAAIESVSTSLGTFTSACKLTLSEVTTDAAGNRVSTDVTLWLSAGSGIQLKLVLEERDSSTPTQVLTQTKSLASGSIKGQAIVAQ